jgi:threonyl-tRNA synthetase
VRYVYGVFGYSYKFELSTRPEKFIGSLENWNKAEATLEKVLND